jgi:sugar lactone lactonase YvrE
MFQAQREESEMRGKGIAFIGLSFVMVGAFALYGLAQQAGAGAISTFAGTGKPGFSGDGGPATAADLQAPTSLAMDEHGNLFVADSQNARLRKVTPAGTIESVNLVTMGAADMVTLDSAGGLYVTSVSAHTVRKVDADGKVTTVAGSGKPGYSGDGGPATAAKMNTPYGLAVDKEGNLFIADSMNHRIRKVSPAGVISTIAGTGKPGIVGKAQKATAAALNFPASLALDDAGNLFVSDVANNAVRKITPAGIISTVAGNGKPGFSGDGGKATGAMLNNPGPIAVGKDGSLFISDVLNHRVRRVSPSGTIATVAGNGDSGADGDGGPAQAAQLAILTGLAVGPVGNIFVADSDSHRVRKITFGP